MNTDFFIKNLGKNKYNDEFGTICFILVKTYGVNELYQSRVYGNIHVHSMVSTHYYCSELHM